MHSSAICITNTYGTFQRSINCVNITSGSAIQCHKIIYLSISVSCHSDRVHSGSGFRIQTGVIQFHLDNIIPACPIDFHCTVFCGNLLIQRIIKTCQHNIQTFYIYIACCIGSTGSIRRNGRLIDHSAFSRSHERIPRNDI